MFRHTISFRIDYTNPAAYDRILRLLVAAVYLGRTADQVWDETTSFYVIETPETSMQLAQRLIAAATLRDEDLLLVKNTNGPDAWAWGKFANFARLKRLMPGVQLLVRAVKNR